MFRGKTRPGERAVAARSAGDASGGRGNKKRFFAQCRNANSIGQNRKNLFTREFIIHDTRFSDKCTVIRKNNGRDPDDHS